MGEPTAEGAAAVVPSSGQALLGAAAGTKADAGERIIAGAIDGLLILALGFLPRLGGLLATVYLLVRDGLDFDLMDRRSFGKRLLRLRPVRNDGRPMDLGTSARRNLPLALGTVTMILPGFGYLFGASLLAVSAVIELVALLGDAQGQRLGDRLAGTRVFKEDELRRRH